MRDEDVVTYAVQEIRHERKRNKGHSFNFAHIFSACKKQKFSFLIEFKRVSWDKNCLMVIIYVRLCLVMLVIVALIIVDGVSLILCTI